MSAAKGWQIGGCGQPVLDVDYNEYDESGIYYVTVHPWDVKIGDRVHVADADGLCFAAVVHGPWLGSEYVGVEITGDVGT